MPIDFQANENSVHPFLIDHSHIKGRIARLGSVVDEILKRHAYPAPVSQLLGEMLALAAMLSSNLKSDGLLTIQAKGDGPVKFMVVDATANGTLRGYAELDGESTALKGKRAKKQLKLSELLGSGYLALTLDHGSEDRYQGIVELAPSTLSDAIQDYFTQSQQMKVAVMLDAKKGAKGWQAGGMMIERLPMEGGTQGKLSAGEEAGEVEDEEEKWKRIRLFMQTLKREELLSPKLSAWDILTRLFNEDGVWAYAPHPVIAKCRCSRERVENILQSLPRIELEPLLQNGEISINCQFCNTAQVFSKDELWPKKSKPKK